MTRIQTGLVLLAVLLGGCFAPSSAPASTPAESDEDECLAELDETCMCAAAAGVPCPDTARNSFEEACGDAVERANAIACLENVMVCEEAFPACET